MRKRVALPVAPHPRHGQPRPVKSIAILKGAGRTPTNGADRPPELAPLHLTLNVPLLRWFLKRPIRRARRAPEEAAAFADPSGGSALTGAPTQRLDVAPRIDGSVGFTKAPAIPRNLRNDYPRTAACRRAGRRSERALANSGAGGQLAAGRGS